MAGAGDTETVVRIRPPGVDTFGDPLPGIPAEVNIDGCLFAPGATTEPGFAAQQVDTDATLYTPAEADIVATDRIRVRGKTYRVVGEPADWGAGWGIVVLLRRVTG